MCNFIGCGLMLVSRTFRFLLLSVFTAFSSPALADVALTFGVYATDKPSEVVRQFRPVLNVLESSLTEILGEPVTITMNVANNYTTGIENLVSGKADFSRFGPASYVYAKEADPAISILAVEGNGGTKTFNGIICVAKGSGIKNVGDLKGKSFAFGSPLSTIGRYLSQLYLFEHGITASDLKRHAYLGRHDKVGIAVGAGLFDAGALKENTFNELVARGVLLEAIAAFPNVTKPWIARGGLPARIKTGLRRALLNIKDSFALAALKKDGFLEGSDKDYEIIREAIEQNPAGFNSTGSEGIVKRSSIEN